MKMTTFRTSQFPVLVVGGTGKTGRRVVDRLRARDIPVRIGSRSASPSFDWQNRDTWAPALECVSAAYVTYYPDLAVPGAADTVGDFVRLAIAKGVRRLVLLSGRGEPEAQRAEAFLQASGADWTIVRASWFMQNFSESMLLDPIRSGALALPASTVREPFVDADDIADVVTTALTDDRHIGKLYEVTGPRAMTFAEATAEISKAAGRTIHYSTITPEQFMLGLQQAAVPGEIAALVNELFTVVLDGRNEYLTEGVMQALGRTPRDFSDYARETAATGLWRGTQ
jgi:uncharacterized protein YbjT (DUF2867 family)